VRRASVTGAKAETMSESGAVTDFASPVAGLGGKMGLDATNKWPGETQREWGRPMAMDADVRHRMDALADDLGL